MTDKKVLVTGVDGYFGPSVARAFRHAGFITYGLTRRADGARRLEKDEIRPVIADIGDLDGLREAQAVGFDVIVSNTEDHGDPAGHYAAVRNMLDFLTAETSSAGTHKPLVLFTSGSKDYGNMDEVAGDPLLKPHTESSPIEPHPFAAARARFAEELLNASGATYDVTVLRPALMYGRSAGLFAFLFEHAAASGDAVVFKARPKTVMHSVHVDDTAAAYVSLAQLANRQAIAGESFNIASAQYETTQDVATALAAAYGKEIRFEEPEDDFSGFNAHLLANTSQWVSSDKIRALTGWSEVMPSLSAGMHDYRLAYEASKSG